jgi:hypothetical protein
MESGTAEMIQRTLALLIPPACREEVLGDLHQRSAGVAERLHTTLYAILSRVRRTSDPVVLLMEGLALYTAFVVVALWIDPALLSDASGMARLAIPPAAMLIILMLADAYSDPKKRWVYKPLLGVVLGSAAAAAVGSTALPRSVLLLGTAFGALLILPIRTAFPPVTERPQSITGAALWHKLELAPVGVFAKYVTAAAIFALLTLVMYAILSLR